MLVHFPPDILRCLSLLEKTRSSFIRVEPNSRDLLLISPHKDPSTVSLHFVQNRSGFDVIPSISRSSTINRHEGSPRVYFLRFSVSLSLSLSAPIFSQPTGWRGQFNFPTESIIGGATGPGNCPSPLVSPRSVAPSQDHIDPAGKTRSRYVHVMRFETFDVPDFSAPAPNPGHGRCNVRPSNWKRANPAKRVEEIPGGVLSSHRVTRALSEVDRFSVARCRTSEPRDETPN